MLGAMSIRAMPFGSSELCETSDRHGHYSTHINCKSRESFTDCTTISLSPNTRRGFPPTDKQECNSLCADDTCNEYNALTYEPLRTRAGWASVPPRTYNDTEIIELSTRFGNAHHNVEATYQVATKSKTLKAKTYEKWDWTNWAEWYVEGGTIARKRKTSEKNNSVSQQNRSLCQYYGAEGTLSGEKIHPNIWHILHTESRPSA